MKTTSILLAALFAATGAFSQQAHKTDVPQAVKTAFTKQYPNVQKVDWDHEGDNYEAEFHQSKIEYSVLYDANGQVLETEMEIGVAELPSAVKDYVKAHYPGHRIKDASKIVGADGALSYEAEVDDHDLIFDDKGQFIKTELH